MNVIMCPCGRPLHYRSPETEAFVESIIRRQGDIQEFVSAGRIWKVPRRYAASHGLEVAELPRLAEQYSWESRPFDPAK